MTRTNQKIYTRTIQQHLQSLNCTLRNKIENITHLFLSCKRTTTKDSWKHFKGYLKATCNYGDLSTCCIAVANFSCSNYFLQYIINNAINLSCIVCGFIVILTFFKYMKNVRDRENEESAIKVYTLHLRLKN